MADCMMFPKDWRDFLKDYSFTDTEQIYTNGSELIPVFRVEQLIEHLLEKPEAVEPMVMNHIVFGTNRKCSKCNQALFPAGKYCPHCGQVVRWND